MLLGFMHNVKFTLKLPVTVSRMVSGDHVNFETGTRIATFSGHKYSQILDRPILQ